MGAFNPGTDIPTGSSKRYAPTVNLCVLNDLWEELITKNETCWARVISSSMSPMIRSGDQVLVERTGYDNLRFGDIIVFKNDKRLIVHRIIGKREVGGEYYLLEKGDAVLQSSLVPPKQIIGRVVNIRKQGKTILVISGFGRLFQLILACISYTSLRLSVMLKNILFWRKHISHKQRYDLAYRRTIFFLYRIVLGLFFKRSGVE
jgi:signal peptidase I